MLLDQAVLAIALNPSFHVKLNSAVIAGHHNVPL